MIFNKLPERLILLVFLLMTSYHVASAQQWVQLAREGAAISEVTKSFENEWEGKEYERGNGWKQFHRWKYFTEQRTYPNDSRIDPGIYWEEKQKLDRLKDKSKRNNSWVSMGPTDWINGSAGYNPGVGRVNVIVRSPIDNNTIFVGTPAGGLWKSTNSGVDWTPLTDDFTSLGVSSIVIDPTDANHLYIGTGDGDGFDTYAEGVFESFDGGSTWQNTGDIASGLYVVRRLVMDPDNPSVIFAATSNGLHRTIDGGGEWTELVPGNFWDLELHPTNPDTIYAATTQFFKSYDGGDSFMGLDTVSGLPLENTINRISIAVCPDEPDGVYIIAGRLLNSAFKGMWKSSDAASTFTQQSSSPNIFNYSSTGSGSGGQSWWDMALAVDPSDAGHVFAAGINLWESLDTGQTWSILTQWYFGNQYGYVHADIHELAFYGDDLYLGSDGGISISSNLGQDWTDLSEGLSITQIYRMGASQQASNKIITGTMDNGTNLRNGGNWTHVYGADGMECLIDYTNSNIMYQTYQNGGLQKSTNGGTSFSGIFGSIPESGAWITPFALHPTNHNIIYAGYQNLWKNTSAGTGTWTKISDVGLGSVNCLKLAPSDPDVLYITKNHQIWKTEDGGDNWSEKTAGLPLLYITSIEVDPLWPDHVYVSFSGFDEGEKMYRSYDGGDIWFNESNNLPNLPVNSIVLQPCSNELIYVGTDVGVFFKNDTMAVWEACAGLPNVIVYELEIHMPAGKLRAATFGRGLWQMDLIESDPPTRLYVDGSIVNEGMGTSWNEPLKSLQNALQIANSCNEPVEIWVRAGTYLPYGNSRDHSFVFASDTRVYGGFGGGETDLSQRDAELHQVVLSGDVGIIADQSDNLYHVVEISLGATGVVLDGVTISNGNANGGAADNKRGAGIICSGIASINNLKIQECQSSQSGSMIWNKGPNGSLQINAVQLLE